MDNSQESPLQDPTVQPPAPVKKHKTMYVVLCALLFIVIICAGAYYTLESKKAAIAPTSSPSPTQAPSPTITKAAVDTNDLQAGGSSFSDTQGIFSVLYPSDYKLDTSDSQHPRIYKVGATQKGQTEMYDGVIVVFETFPLQGTGTTLSDFVDSSIQAATADGTAQIVHPKTPFTVKKYKGYTYAIKSLGEATYYVLQKDTSSNYAITITTSVTDPQNIGYQKEVDKILATLEIMK